MDGGLRRRPIVRAEEDGGDAVGGADLDAMRSGRAGKRCQAVRKRGRPLREEQQREHTRQRWPEARHRPFR